jgi:hypothetical protein
VPTVPAIIKHESKIAIQTDAFEPVELAEATLVVGLLVCAPKTAGEGEIEGTTRGVAVGAGVAVAAGVGAEGV